MAAIDSDGRPLDRACRYRIDGTTPVATFWTLSRRRPTRRASITRADAPAPLSTAPASPAPMTARWSSMSAARWRRSNWLEITGDGPFALDAHPLRHLQHRRRRHRGRHPALDHPRGLRMIRTVLWIFGGLVLGGIIHITVILALPGPDRRRRVVADRRPLGALNKPRRAARPCRPASPIRCKLDPELSLRRLPDRPAQGPGVGRRHACRRPSGRLAVYSRAGIVLYSTTNRDGIGTEPRPRHLQLGADAPAGRAEARCRRGPADRRGRDDDVYIVVRLAPPHPVMRARYESPSPNPEAAATSPT